MQYERLAMGSDYSQWEQLTEDYLDGMEALRRRESGASEYMMRIAREMQQCEARTMGTFPCTPEATSFGQSTMRTALTPHRKARGNGWIASTLHVLMPSRKEEHLDASLSANA